MKRAKNTYNIQAVSNAAALIEVFQGGEEFGVSELARRLGLHKNNVFRLLATLQECGYIEQEKSSDRYRLGPRCYELGRAYLRHGNFGKWAQSLLGGLVRETGETVHLGVLRDFEVLHLQVAVSDQLLRAVSRVGKRLPSHCTALGKVLLGCGDIGLKEAYDRDVVHAGRLEACTTRSLLDREKLFEELRAVGTQGYALDNEECEVGIRCVAAPVRDGSSGVVAAVSISAPAFRMSETELVERVVPVLQFACDRISRGLGYRPSL